MCEQLWHVLVHSAPLDGATWYEQVIHGAEGLDDQVLVESLGSLAWIQASNFANYSVGAALGARSDAIADARHVRRSPSASLGQSTAAMCMGEPTDGLRFAELGLTEAEARDDGCNAVFALGIQTGTLAALGDVGRSAEAATESLRRAERTGHPVALTSAVACACAAHLWVRVEPDFAAALEVLDRYDVQPAEGDLSGMWLDLMRGTALLGLDRSGAGRHLARAARGADQLNSLHLLELALRQLAIAAARAGLTEQAIYLARYSATALRTYQMDQPGQAWVQAHLDAALAGAARPPSEPATLHRGEIMAIVNQVDARLAEDGASV
jgi:hypothetical protein